MAKGLSIANHVLKLFISVLLVLMLVQKCGAYEFMVGGSDGWTVPTNSGAQPYNKWAESKRFQIGDKITFVYQEGKDSVLHVTFDDYTNCNTNKPLKKFSDGHTKFRFDHSGPQYFISGVRENCLKNEKMEVVVMADRSDGAASVVMNFMCSIGAFVGASLLVF